MILGENEQNTSIAYRCPSCTRTIFGCVGIFNLSGDLIKVKCECGGSELSVIREKENRLRLTVPCLLCGQDHRYVVARDALRRGELLPLCCPYTGLEIACAGRHEAVAKEMEAEGERLQKVLDSAGVTLADYRGDGGRLPDEDPENLGDLVRFLLCELDEEGNIHCGCQEAGEIPLYNFQLLSERVRIYCECCRREITLPLRSLQDAEQFLKIDALTLEEP